MTNTETTRRSLRYGVTCMRRRAAWPARKLAQVGGIESEPLPLSADGLVPAQLLNDDEIVILAMKPSLWFIPLVSLWWLAFCVPLVIVGWQYRDAGEMYSRLGQLALGCSIVRICCGVIQWLARFYVLTDRRILSVAGIFNVNVFECSLLRVQHTLMRLSLPERVLGVGTIGFATAGTGGIESVWRHVGDPLEVQSQVQLAIEKARRRYGQGQP